MDETVKMEEENGLGENEQGTEIEEGMNWLIRW